ncbi:MAG: DUF1080 domain-containing protein [Oceanicoccus sp.]
MRNTTIFVALGFLSPILVCADEAITPAAPIALFNGNDLSNWTADIPAADKNPHIDPSFVVRDGLLVSLGDPRGHLVSNTRYRDFQLNIEYRFPGNPGNAGVLIHSSKLRALYHMFPQSIEVQMQSGDAGDFWVIEEDIVVDDMEIRRPRKPGQQWGGSHGDARRVINVTDTSEQPLGEWNTMVVEAKQDTIKVWVNGDLVNEGYNASVSEGHIALQAEGSVVEVRRMVIQPIQ